VVQLEFFETDVMRRKSAPVFVEKKKYPYTNS